MSEGESVSKPLTEQIRDHIDYVGTVNERQQHGHKTNEAINQGETLSLIEYVKQRLHIEAKTMRRMLNLEKTDPSKESDK
jgi:hypothetical protein